MSRKEWWLKVRDETGVCETCGQKMSEHDQCKACGILCGENHEDKLKEGLCLYCWRKS